MGPFVIWTVFATSMALFCLWRPQAARLFLGLFFAVMGLGVHGAIIVGDPHRYVEFAGNAPIGIYRDIALALTEPMPLAFGITMLLLETVLAALVLSRGRWVNLGLLGIVVFLISIAPLGVEELPNLVMAVGVGHLLMMAYPEDVVTMVRTWASRRRQVLASPSGPAAREPLRHETAGPNLSASAGRHEHADPRR